MSSFNLSVEYCPDLSGQDNDMFSLCTNDNGNISGFISMRIWDASPPHAGDYYRVDTFNVKSLQQIKTEYAPYLLVFQMLDVSTINNYLFDLAKKCSTSGEVYTAFMQYATLEYGGTYWPLDVPIGQKIPNFEPSLSWHFENGDVIPATQTMYDERIIIDISWPEDGSIKTFRGYWYAISTAFIEQRLQKQDPYYRRYVLVAHIFDPTKLTAQLQTTLAYLAAQHPSKRLDYLQHHFEYDGQTMFYER